jgi:hypothetical protein
MLGISSLSGDDLRFTELLQVEDYKAFLCHVTQLFLVSLLVRSSEYTVFEDKWAI